jgi:hypothetical protein
MATYHYDTDAMQESSSWLKQNLETLLDGMNQAKSKIETLVENGYNTPGSQGKFKPYFDEYKGSVDQTLDGMRGIAEFIGQVSDATVDMDNQTAGSLG